MIEKKPFPSIPCRSSIERLQRAHSHCYQNSLMERTARSGGLRRWQLRPWPSIHEGSRLVPRTVSPLIMGLLNVTGDTDTPFHLFSSCVFAKALLFETVHRKGNHSTDVRNCWEEVVRTQFPPKSVASFQPTPRCPV